MSNNAIFTSPQTFERRQTFGLFFRHLVYFSDMVAIPDFASGAMEHWGVITFRETNLLYDPLNSSPQNLQRISAVIAHEMAHMVRCCRNLPTGKPPIGGAVKITFICTRLLSFLAAEIFSVNKASK